MKNAVSSKYLGIHIQNDGKNKLTIKDNTGKAIRQIKNKLDEMKDGKYYIEVALIK